VRPGPPPRRPTEGSVPTWWAGARVARWSHPGLRKSCVFRVSDLSGFCSTFLVQSIHKSLLPRVRGRLCSLLRHVELPTLAVRPDEGAVKDGRVRKNPPHPTPLRIFPRDFKAFTVVGCDQRLRKSERFRGSRIIRVLFLNGHYNFA
jgi:hypothetical protein